VAVFDGVSEVHHNGEFGHSISIPFDVASPDMGTIEGGIRGPTTHVRNSSSPTPLPLIPSTTAGAKPTPRTSLRVEILYDDYPEETSWSIMDNTTGVEMYSSPAYSGMAPLELVATYIPDLRTGHSYMVIIQDLAGDGVCCLYGKGSVQVVMVAPSGKESVVWNHRGDFGSGAKAIVEVPVP
jgi:hypothetical protein